MVSYVSNHPRTLPDDEIVRLYVEGLDSGTVGLRAGCSSTKVLELVRAAGQPVRRRGGPSKHVSLRLTPAEIKRLYQEGHSGPTIADQAGTTPNTIYSLLRKQGVKLRDPSSAWSTGVRKSPS